MGSKMLSSLAESSNAMSSANNEDEPSVRGNITKANTIRLESGMEYYRERLKIAQEQGLKGEEAQTLSHIGDSLQHAGKHEEAIKYGLRSLKLFQELNDKVYVQVLCLNLGIKYDKAGQYETALDWSHKSLEMAQELGNKLQEAKTLQNIGTCYYHAGKPKKAIEYYLRSLKLYQELNNKVREQWLYLDLGVVYRSTGQYETAIVYYQKALVIAQELEDKKAQKQSYFGLEDLYHKMGDPAKALESYKTAVEIAPLLRDEEKIRSTLVENAEQPLQSIRTEATDDRGSQPSGMGPEENSYADHLQMPEAVKIALRIPGEWVDVALLTGKFEKHEIENIRWSRVDENASLKARAMLQQYIERQGSRKTLTNALRELGNNELADKVLSGYFNHD